MTLEDPSVTLAQRATKLKLLAMKLKALGSETELERWETTHAFHQAAVAQLEALASMPCPIKHTQDTVYLEAAALFYEAGNPVQAYKHWYRASQERREQEEPAKLSLRIDQYQISYQKAQTTLAKIYVPARRLVRINAMLSLFPGVSSLWVQKSIAAALWQELTPKNADKERMAQESALALERSTALHIKA